MWLDANGARIPVVGTADYWSTPKVFPLLLVTDPNGLIWPVDPTTGKPYGGSNVLTPIHYSGADCSGTPYVSPSDVLPGFVYVAYDTGTTFAVVVTGTATTTVATFSIRQPNLTCTNVAWGTLPMYPFVATAAPSAQFFAPPARPQIQ